MSNHNRAKYVRTIKKNYDNIKLCTYGCNKIAKYLIGKNETPCCSYNRMKCSEERRKNSERQLGQIPWNKGLTKEDPRVEKYSKSMKYLKLENLIIN